MSKKAHKDTMKRKTKQELKPKLRFPEFRDEPAWKESKLSSIVNLVSGVHLSPNDYSEQGDMPYFTGPSDFTNNVQCIKKWTALSTNTAEANDTLITVKGSGVGEIWYLSLSSVAIGRQLMAIQARNSSSHFVYQFLLMQKTRFENLASGNLIPGLSRGDILSLTAPLPSLLKQKRIADCLTSLDELIAAHGRKLDALKDHKKGLMQSLFPCQGQTQPRLRFPEFRDALDWEVKKAGSLFTNRKEKGEHGLPIYSVTINKGMILRSSFDRNFYDIEDPAGNKRAHKEDIAYNMMRMWQGAFGVAPENCMVSPAYVVLCPRKGVCSGFFDSFFKLPESLQFLTAYSRGLTSDRLRLYYDDFATIPLRIPKFAEQVKIAKCFSSLDDLITSQAQKLDTLKTHKKGLMQQLFPSLERAKV